jgi:hypothetical protein
MAIKKEKVQGVENTMKKLDVIFTELLNQSFSMSPTGTW